MGLAEYARQRLLDERLVAVRGHEHRDVRLAMYFTERLGPHRDCPSGPSRAIEAQETGPLPGLRDVAPLEQLRFLAQQLEARRIVGIVDAA